MSRKKTVKTVNKIFASNILHLINEKCNGNKRDFGKSVGAEYDTVRSWCIGEYLPGGTQLAAMKETYNISLDWLFTGREGGELLDIPPEVLKYCHKIKKIFESGEEGAAMLIKTSIDSTCHGIEKIKKMKDDLEKEKQARRHKKILKHPEQPAGTDQGVLSNTGKRAV